MIYKDAVKYLRLKLCSKVPKDVIVAYNELCQAISNMKTDMEIFENECSEKFDMCKYVLQGLKLVNLVELLVTTDVNDNWILHVTAVEELMLVFFEFDSINYLRHPSWYLRRIKVLESKNPYLYKTFMQEHYVVKDKQRKFNGVSPDMNN